MAKTILLVEDNPDDELLALRALRKNGIQEGITVVRDGAEALDFLFARGSYADRTTDQLPSVVLLDLNLPKLNGLEVLKQLRAHEETKYLPVVILTTSTEERDMVQGYHFGANSFICKPIDYDQFIQAIEQLGRYWLLLNETPAKPN
jgi:two-component system response regulator